MQYPEHQDGRTRHPLYTIWKGMKARCYQETNTSYPWYGGKGIKVCDEWLYDFFRFANDMGDRPDGYTLERRENDKDYCKSNCYWASRGTQARNNARNIKTPDGVAVDTSARLGGAQSLVAERIKKLGWDLEKAINTPLNKKPRQLVTVGDIVDTPTGWARRLGVTQSCMALWVKKIGAEAAVRKVMEKRRAVRE